MKLTFRSKSFSYFLAFTICFLSVTVSCGKSVSPSEHNPKSVMNMIPQESLAYVSLTDLDAVFHLVTESPEWQELMSIEEIQQQLDEVKQPISFIPMLLGISAEEFLGAFGHETVLCVMGMMGPMPIAGLVIDAGPYKDKLEYAASQAGTIPAVAGGAMVEEKEYRDVSYTVVGNQNIKVKYGFLDDYLIAGVGGGFEKLVDHNKDGGRSIVDSPNFQFMKQKVSLSSSNLCVYADLERAAPMLEMLAGIGHGEEENPPAEMLKQLALSSSKAFALCLSLSGHNQEMYLHLRQEEPNPIADLVLAPVSPMSSARLVPFDNGVMVGVNIGDPVELMDRGFRLAEILGVETGKIEAKIQEVEAVLGISLREDLLSTLTGEVAAMSMLPEEPIDLEANKLEAFMKMSSAPAANFIGVKDGEKLGETIKKLLKIVNVEPMSLKEESYEGTTIHTGVVPLGTSGVALMPSYAFWNDLMIMSNLPESVQSGIDMLESAQVTEIQEKLSDSRVLVYLDAGGVANFVIEQGIAEEIGIPKEIQDKASSLGSVAASVSLGPDGAGIRLISTSEDNWATKILRGALIAIQVKAAEMQAEVEEQAEMEHEEAEEEQ